MLTYMYRYVTIIFIHYCGSPLYQFTFMWNFYFHLRWNFIFCKYDIILENFTQLFSETIGNNTIHKLKMTTIWYNGTSYYLFIHLVIVLLWSYILSFFFYTLITILGSIWCFVNLEIFISFFVSLHSGFISMDLIYVLLPWLWLLCKYTMHNHISGFIPTK